MMANEDMQGMVGRIYEDEEKREWEHSRLKQCMMFQKRTNDDEERYGANEEEESTIRQENGFEKQKNSREHWRNLVQIKGIYWLTLTAIALSIAWIWQKRENSAVE